MRVARIRPDREMNMRHFKLETHTRVHDHGKQPPVAGAYFINHSKYEVQQNFKSEMCVNKTILLTS